MKVVLIILAIILLAGVVAVVGIFIGAIYAAIEADTGSTDIDGLEPTDESGPQRPE